MIIYAVILILSLSSNLTTILSVETVEKKKRKKMRHLFTKYDTKGKQVLQ